MNDEDRKNLTLKVGEVIEKWLLDGGYDGEEGYILLMIDQSGHASVTSNLTQPGDIAHIIHETGREMLNNLDKVNFVLPPQGN